jgi:hypothetical protein
MTDITQILRRFYLPDEAGRHFSQRFEMKTLREMERSGLVTIHDHHPLVTEWKATLTDEGFSILEQLMDRDAMARTA